VEALLAAAVSVLLLGDSHVAGAFAGGTPAGAAPFSEVLRRELGAGYSVAVAGCSGSSVRDWTVHTVDFFCAAGGAYPALARPQLPADVVVVLLGSNDAAGYLELTPVEPDEYARLMAQLVERIAGDGGHEILLVGPPPVPFPLARATRAVRLRGYTEALRALATGRPHVHMGPALLELLNRDDHFGPSQIHMNAAGHRAVGEALARDVAALAEALRETPPAPDATPDAAPDEPGS
jgi:lysophospholipase L1-like esterase